MKSPLTIPSRIIVAVASLSLIATYFLPVWFIFLIAPQYPEGLTMNIWLTKLTGQVDIINGLNHYIGMKHISAEMFPEFNYLVYIVGFFILFGVVVSITGSRKLLTAYLLITIAGGAAALFDFYQWGYKYGHNLDPKAPIQIPGLYYQPPVVGHKTLLNFDAYSYPASGGWIVVVVGCLFGIVWAYEWYRNKKNRNAAAVRSLKKVIPAAAVVSLLLSACTTKPEVFVYGKDVCSDCKMTIVDPKFGGEILTKKGRVYKFDDAHCLANFIHKGVVKQENIGQILFVDYLNEGKFIDSKEMFFAVSPQLKSPMSSNAASFSNEASASKTAKETSGKVEQWNNFFDSL